MSNAYSFIARFFPFLMIILTLVLVDQISKIMLIQYFNDHNNINAITILPILDFVSLWNHGISLGLFAEYRDKTNLIFLIINMMIVLYLIFLLMRQKSKLGLILVISGACGNLCDRIIWGAVFDFIHFHYNEIAFPAFNIADSLITIGICWIILYGNPKSIGTKNA